MTTRRSMSIALLVSTMVATGCAKPPALERVTGHRYATSDLATLDPQLASDTESFAVIADLFVMLTNLDPTTLEAVPEAATRWEVSDDGTVYTFTLRTDIPWISHNPTEGSIRQEVDEKGQPRWVMAQDFEYGIKRICDPTLSAYYSSIVAPLIRGCEEVLFYEDPRRVPLELMDAIGVRAESDDTLVIELAFSASYFLAMTSMSGLAAAPHWAIEDHGTRWIEPGNIVTSGRYVLHQWERGAERIIWRNPLMPADLQGQGNVERWVDAVVSDEGAGYSMWLAHEVDLTNVPLAKRDAHLMEYGDLTQTIVTLAVTYVGFGLEKPPFDDVRVRRAFGAAICRQALVTEVRDGWDLPMIHFAPPGIFGAPPIDEVGVGYDPAFAQEQLAEAGYPGCQGFPQVELLGFGGPGMWELLESLQTQWEEVLGCGAHTVWFDQLPWPELLEAIDGPARTKPDMWVSGWSPDYPEESNWVGDVLWCRQTGRECSEVDDLIVEARGLADPRQRIELYLQIEEGFFGPEGEAPIAPLLTTVAVQAHQPYIDCPPSSEFAPAGSYGCTLDWDAKKEVWGQ